MANKKIVKKGDTEENKQQNNTKILRKRHETNKNVAIEVIHLLYSNNNEHRYPEWKLSWTSAKTELILRR